MKKLLVATTLALGLQHAAWAGYLEGVAAYKAKHYAQAYQELAPLAKAGHTDAQYLLGLMHYTGQGVAQNYRQAGVLLQKAAAKGRADAQYVLASMYFTGQGVDEDKEQAVAWFRKAAVQGHAEAQYLLGLMYKNHAAGMPRDPVIACMLWNLAAAGGSSNAAEQRAQIVKRMSREQIEEARALAAAWKAGSPLPAASRTGADAQ